MTCKLKRYCRAGYIQCDIESPDTKIASLKHCFQVSSNYPEGITFIGEDVIPASPNKRVFSSGANRDSEEGKLDYEGFYSPLVKKRFAEYMNENRKLKDGSIRDSDNWQKGIPLTAYAKSLNRHFEDFHLLHRGYPEEAREDIEESICGIIFNAQGYLFEILKEKKKCQ